jgi:hypothetical protein
MTATLTRAEVADIIHYDLWAWSVPEAQNAVDYGSSYTLDGRNGKIIQKYLGKTIARHTIPDKDIEWMREQIKVYKMTECFAEKLGLNFAAFRDQQCAEVFAKHA